VRLSTRITNTRGASRTLASLASDSSRASRYASPTPSSLIPGAEVGRAEPPATRSRAPAVDRQHSRALGLRTVAATLACGESIPRKTAFRAYGSPPAIRTSTSADMRIHSEHTSVTIRVRWEQAQGVLCSVIPAGQNASYKKNAESEACRS